MYRILAWIPLGPVFPSPGDDPGVDKVVNVFGSLMLTFGQGIAILAMIAALVYYLLNRTSDKRSKAVNWFIGTAIGFVIVTTFATVMTFTTNIVVFGLNQLA